MFKFRRRSPRKRFEEFRRFMGDALFYDMAAAVRGPDDECHALKTIFAARIRHFLGVDGKHAEVRDTMKINVFLVANAVLSLRPSHFHYIAHAAKALKRLHHMKVIDSKEFTVLYRLADILLTLILALTRDGEYIHSEDMFIEYMDKLVELIESNGNIFWSPR